MPKTPYGLETVQLNARFDPTTAAALKEFAVTKGTVADSIRDCCKDVLFWFGLPPHLTEPLKAEAARMKLSPRDYMQNVLAERATALLRDGPPAAPAKGRR